ncbi:MAG: BMP family ABC transporter substrate-binding protein [Candidatus Thorarchaeota archaeon]|nr:BMP family ABC transporter substrate-binding protein [Candidatus Thorarchaeota archaeon]
MSSNRTVLAIIVIVIIGVGAVAAYILWNPAPLPDNPDEIAIVFATGGLGDRSFNDGCYAGAEEAADEFDITYTYVEPTAITEYEGYHRAYAAHAQYANAYDLIIGIGFDQADAISAVAEDYPNQKWAIVDMWINDTTYPNVASILFNENEGSALVGAIAGLTTETGNIGFVGGMDIPLINKFAAGYHFGANLTYFEENANNITMDVLYVGDWADTATGQSLADGLYTTGTDIIFAAAGRSGLGVFDSVANNNETYGPLWVIGVDSPQMYIEPGLVLTSMLKRVDVAVHDIIEDVIEDTFVTFNLFTLANGGLDYEVNSTLYQLPTAVVTRVEALKADIADGTIVVPSEIYWL